jgi:ubiquinone/menaquinone biosynthesis C-methylase UbiE
MPEATFKHRLVKQARIEKGQRVLDLGCGTATLTTIIKKLNPEANVIGLDGDPGILGIARAKIIRAGLDIKLDRGMAYQLPYPDNSFDRVISSFLFHHLTLDNKKRTLTEVYRVLQPGGEFHIADFGKPGNILMYLISLIMRYMEETRDNIKGLLPQMAEAAGFQEVEETARFLTLFGSSSLYRMKKPDGHQG